MIERLIGAVGQGVGQVPILGDVGRLSQDILVGPQHAQLTPMEQIARAFTTAVITGNSPGSYPGLMSAYQTQDAALAKSRADILASDVFQQDYKSQLAAAGEGADELKVFRAMGQVYPDLIGYNPPMRDGQVVLPMTAGQKAAAETEAAVGAVQGAPKGVGIQTVIQPGKQAKVTISSVQEPANEFPGSMIFNDQAIVQRIANGELRVVDVGIRHGEQYFRVETTDVGKAMEAGRVAEQQAAGRFRAEYGPQGPPPGAPGAAAPPGSESIAEKRIRMKEESARRQSSEKALRNAEATAAEINGIVTEAVKLISELPSYEETANPLKSVSMALGRKVLESMPANYKYSKPIAAYAAWVEGPVATKLAKLAGEVRPTDVDVRRMVQAFPQLGDTNEVRADKLRRMPEVMLNTLDNARQKYIQDFGMPPPGPFDPVMIRKEIARALIQGPEAASPKDRLRKAFEQK